MVGGCALTRVLVQIGVLGIYFTILYPTDPVVVSGRVRVGHVRAPTHIPHLLHTAEGLLGECIES